VTTSKMITAELNMKNKQALVQLKTSPNTKISALIL